VAALVILQTIDEFVDRSLTLVKPFQGSLAKRVQQFYAVIRG
jgi:hypothetical protein